MYRPTVRYNSIYKSYVDDLFQSTHLDRNQIIRAALFAAAHSDEFLTLMKEHKRSDVPLPSPEWRLDQPEVWMERDAKLEKRGRDVSNVDDRRTGKIEDGFADDGQWTKFEKEGPEEYRRQREVERRPRQIRNGSGGISIRIG